MLGLSSITNTNDDDKKQDKNDKKSTKNNTNGLYSLLNKF